VLLGFGTWFMLIDRKKQYKLWRRRWQHWKRLERYLFQLFADNLVVVLDFLILQGKHNIRTFSGNIYKKNQNCTSFRNRKALQYYPLRYAQIGLFVFYRISISHNYILAVRKWDDVSPLRDATPPKGGIH